MTIRSNWTDIIFCSRNEEEIRSGKNSIYDKIAIEKGFVQTDHERHKYEHDEHGDEVFERLKKEDVDDNDVTLLCIYTWYSYEDACIFNFDKRTRRNDCSVYNDV